MKVEIVYGPMYEQVKREAQKYIAQIIKEQIKQGKFSKSIS